MMTRLPVIGALFVIAAVLQTAVFSHLTLGGYRPDLVLLLTVLFGMREGPEVGLRVGFGAGLLVDLLLTQSAFGISALVYLTWGWVAGVVRPQLAPGSQTGPLVVTFGSGILATVAFGAVARIVGGDQFTLFVVLRTAVMVGVYNLLLAPLALRVVDAVVGWVGVESSQALP